jgi:hypothetical protein
MEQVLNIAQSDVVLFLDIDCVPTTNTVILELARFALKYNTFIGPAQATNCIKDSSHVFAAPACLAISVRAWKDLGSPTLLENEESDVAQNLSRVADSMKFFYRAFYPIGYDKAPSEGIWRLGNFGFYGIGTVYDPFATKNLGYVYHLYQGRLRENQSLFDQRCTEIINGTFSCNPKFISILS